MTMTKTEQGYVQVENAKQLILAGHKVIRITYENGTSEVKRMFLSGGSVGVFYRRSSKRGYHFTGYDVVKVEAVGAIKVRKTYRQEFEGNLRKYKNAFLNDAHPTVWADMKTGYANLDIDAFMEIVNEYPEGETPNLYTKLSRFCMDTGVTNISFGNTWKRTTVKSHLPKRYAHYATACADSIKGHLDNQEDFRYYWEADYDVTVSGKMGADGVYRAFLNLEYKGVGNGHYYTLINENSAVHYEDD